MDVKPQEHWEQVYREKDPMTDVSWFQAKPTMSLKLISATGIARHQPIIDVGGGASVLVDYLLQEGFRDISVLDISNAALQFAQNRLAVRAREVAWVCSDVTVFEPARQYSLWHDRAVFHFLTAAEGRAGYVSVLKKALQPGGHFILATFAEDGPTRCSGLPVMRYDAAAISAEFGPEFQLCEQGRETHITPWITEQKFNWFRFRRKSLSPTPADASQPRNDRPSC